MTYIRMHPNLSDIFQILEEADAEWVIWLYQGEAKEVLYFSFFFWWAAVEGGRLGQVTDADIPLHYKRKSTLRCICCGWGWAKVSAFIRSWEEIHMLRMYPTIEPQGRRTRWRVSTFSVNTQLNTELGAFSFKETAPEGMRWKQIRSKLRNNVIKQGTSIQSGVVQRYTITIIPGNTAP